MLDFVNENQVFTHPGQEQMQVEVILASRHADYPQEKPLYTIRLRYPRIIHGEVLTHRVFSRNSRSSRAVPVKTMLLETTIIPFIPWHWGKNQPGMQSYTPLSADEEREARRLWLEGRDAAVRVVEQLMNPDGLNAHKQNPNRLLEPYSWIDVLITSNDWDNFLWLRDHEDAEPHLQDLARLVKKAIDAAHVQELKPGEWHLPYITDEDRSCAITRTYTATDSVDTCLCKISAARCARISYAPFNGDASYEAEMRRYELLVKSDRVHASPLEHQATPDSKMLVRIENLEFEADVDTQLQWCSPHLHGNLIGWCQARKSVPNEHYTGA